MAKDVFFNHDAVKKLEKGFNIVGNAAGSTLGPHGKTVIISSGYGHMPVATKDGVTVVKSTFLKDEVENTGVMLIRGAAEKTLDMGGDGTTTATVLAQSILNNGIKEILNRTRVPFWKRIFGIKPVGCNVHDVRSGIEKSVNSISNSLRRMSISVTDSSTLKDVATIAANNDSFIGGQIANAYHKIGLKGLLTIEDSKTIETTIQVLPGAEFPGGYAAKEFCTDQSKMIVEYENPMILVLDYELKVLKDLEVIMKEITGSVEEWTRPWIIIARGFDGEVFNTMVVNKLKNGVKICLIKAPTAYQKEALRDVATLTGAALICDEFGKKVKHSKMDDMGTCHKIVVSNISTRIIGGNPNKEGLEQILKEIEIQKNDTDNDQLKDILEKRAARLTGSIGVIYVGGATDVERKERKDRVDDAKRAVESAIQEGVVVGGGVALIRCINDLNNIGVRGDEEVGVELIRKACMAPLQKMLKNAGLDLGIANEVSDRLTGNYGYNVKTKEFENLYVRGVVDPAKVVRCALQNAASVASQVLTSEVLLVEMRPPGA